MVMRIGGLASGMDIDAAPDAEQIMAITKKNIFFISFHRSIRINPHILFIHGKTVIRNTFHLPLTLGEFPGTIIFHMTIQTADIGNIAVAEVDTLGCLAVSVDFRSLSFSVTAVYK